MENVLRDNHKIVPQETPLDTTGLTLETYRPDRDLLQYLSKSERTIPANVLEDLVEGLPGPPQRRQLLRLNWARDKGDTLFQEGRYEAAMLKYKEAIRHLLTFDIPTSDSSCDAYMGLAWVRYTIYIHDTCLMLFSRMNTWMLSIATLASRSV